VISLNCLGGTLANREALQIELRTLGGGLVMDDLPLAQAVGAVYRVYNANDSQWWQMVSPYAWAQSHSAFGGLTIQVHNEPVVTPENVASFVGWHVELLKVAAYPLAVGGFAVGNPDIHLIENGAFDPLLKALRPQDSLLLHEYFRDRPMTDSPWLCGRVSFWLERMKRVGCVCKHVVIGEYGRDVGGGREDGWRGTGWSAEDYAARLMEGLAQIYAPLAAAYGVTIDADVFCAGSGYNNDWQSFNVEGERALYTALETWNAKERLVTDTYLAGAHPMLKTTQVALNLRTDPLVTSTNIVRTLEVGEVVTVYETPVLVMNNYAWQRVVDRSGKSGFAAISINGQATLLSVPPASALTPAQFTALESLSQDLLYQQGKLADVLLAVAPDPPF
jgi:hypothetical protein